MTTYAINNDLEGGPPFSHKTVEADHYKIEDGYFKFFAKPSTHSDGLQPVFAIRVEHVHEVEAIKS